MNVSCSGDLTKGRIGGGCIGAWETKQRHEKSSKLKYFKISLIASSFSSRVGRDKANDARAE